MDSYEIEWKTSADRELRGIDRKYIPRIIKAVESLACNPFPLRKRKLYDVEASYRIRVGDYRIIYHVDPEGKKVVIYHIRHRKDAYKK